MQVGASLLINESLVKLRYIKRIHLLNRDIFSMVCIGRNEVAVFY